MAAVFRLRFHSVEPAQDMLGLSFDWTLVAPRDDFLSSEDIDFFSSEDVDQSQLCLPEVCVSLQRARERGARVGIVTARSWKMLKRDWQRFGIPAMDFVICDIGSSVRFADGKGGYRLDKAWRRELLKQFDYKAIRDAAFRAFRDAGIRAVPHDEYAENIRAGDDRCHELKQSFYADTRGFDRAHLQRLLASLQRAVRALEGVDVLVTCSDIKHEEPFAGQHNIDFLPMHGGKENAFVYASAVLRARASSDQKTGSPADHRATARKFYFGDSGLDFSALTSAFNIRAVPRNVEQDVLRHGNSVASAPAVRRDDRRYPHHLFRSELPASAGVLAALCRFGFADPQDFSALTRPDPTLYHHLCDQRMLFEKGEGRKSKVFMPRRRRAEPVPVNYDLLRTFVEAAHGPTFDLAAARCGIARTALSQQIKTLEGQLGVPLFERVGRQARPTRSGRALHASITREFRRIDDALREVVAVHRDKEGPVALALCGAVAPLWMRAQQIELAKAHPDIDVQCASMNDREAHAALANGTVDIAIWCDDARSNLFESILIRREKLVAVATREYLARCGDSGGVPSALCFATYHTDDELEQAWLRSAWGRTDEPSGPTLRPVENADVALLLVRNHLAAAVFPATFVRVYGAGLTVINDQNGERTGDSAESATAPEMGIFVVRRSGSVMNARSEAVWAVLTAASDHPVDD